MKNKETDAEKKSKFHQTIVYNLERKYSAELPPSTQLFPSHFQSLFLYVRGREKASIIEG